MKDNNKNINTEKNTQNKIIASTSSPTFINNILEKTAVHFFGPTYHPELPRKNQSVNLNPLLEDLKDFNPEDINFIKKAFYFADKAHLGQYRHSGEPYITHPLAVAQICASWRLGKNAICAALLHDVIEDQGITKSELVADFGIQVADLVEGLTKLTHIEFNSKEEAKAANFERLLASSAKDHKVVLVKIADRLHNMRTLSYMTQTKQQIIAKETQEIYAPFAKRLGLHQAYNELQDLSFLYSYPWRYDILQRAMQSQHGVADDFIYKICNNIKLHLDKHNINGNVYGHIKTPYIIYTKLKKKKQSYGNIKFRDMQDLLGFEIVVNTRYECYIALGILHNIFKPKPGKFKDYIALPKRNGYRGLHTTLIDNHGHAFSMQIRTKQMQKIAQSGVIAFLEEDNNDYSNNKNDIDIDIENFSFAENADSLLHSLQELRQKTNNFSDLLYYSKIDLCSDEIVVFDATGNPILIPRYSTALDFAYHVSYEIGNTTQALEVNGSKATLSRQLKNGDLVKIKTNTNIKPQEEWLKIVKTSRAKIAIKYYLDNSNQNSNS